MPTTCPQCGTAATSEAAFCSGCGASLAAAEGQQTPPPPPPPDDQPVPPPPLGAGARSGPSASDARNLSLLAHLSALIAFASIPSFVGPLVVWLWKRDTDPYVAEHAREALNFNLSWLLYGLVGGIIGAIVAFVTLGLALIVLVPVGVAFAVAWVALVVIAGLAASRGEGYRYPLTIRFVS